MHLFALRRTLLSCLGALLILSAPARAGTRIEKTFNLSAGGRFRLETGMGRSASRERRAPARGWS